MVRTLSKSTRPAMEWAKRHLDGPLPSRMYETLSALSGCDEMFVKDITARIGRTKNFGLRELTALGLVITDKSDTMMHRFIITNAGQAELAAQRVLHGAGGRHR